MASPEETEVKSSLKANSEDKVERAITDDDNYGIVVIDPHDANTVEVNVEETIKQIGGTKQESAWRNPPGIFERLTSGNLSFLSKTEKCVNFLNAIVGESSSVQKSLLKVSYQNSATSIPNFKSFEGTCEYILDELMKINCQTLVQERWLIETKHLLNNQILTIGVFGRHKAGKSTVLNALLHQDLLPSAVTNETAILTEIHHDKSRHIIGCNDCQTENCQNCPAWGKILGHEKIRDQLQHINSNVRKKVTPLKDVQCNAVVACVPFMSPCQIGEMKVVLMDTPGLAEANELGITDIAEHQLMTCSAYIYVISCTQLEDEIDIETLRAIVERDPGVFIQCRMLIVVTRLDEYKEAKKQPLDGLIKSIKEQVKQQFKPICEVPDNCIFPVSAKGALEARKVMNGGESEDLDVLLLQFKKKVGTKEVTTEELNQYSQVPLLEGMLFTIVLAAYPVWKHAIVRDCSRYLTTAIIELQNMENIHREVEKDYSSKYKNKDKISKKYVNHGNRCKQSYQHESSFHKSLESAYEDDVKSHQSFVEKECNDQFQFFKDNIMSKEHITSEEYHVECEKFLEEANSSLASTFGKMQFRKVNQVMKKAYIELGQDCNTLKSLLLEFCGQAIDSSPDENAEISEYARSDSITALPENISVKSAPLKLEDLLGHVNYTILDKVKILARNFISMIFKITDKDPKQKLLDTERDALLEKQRLLLQEESKKYFINIKGNIINGYIKEQVKTIEDYMRKLKITNKVHLLEMNEKMAFWRESADTHRIMADRYEEKIKFLKELKLCLEPMYRETCF